MIVAILVGSAIGGAATTSTPTLSAAKLVAASTPAPSAAPVTFTRPGTYKVTDKQGRHGTVTITVGSSLSPGGARANLASASVVSHCGYFHATENFGLQIDFLSTDFCWNGSTAVGYNTTGSCTPNLIGQSCQGTHFADACSYCWTAQAYGDYYQTCNWLFECNDQVNFYMRGNGSWWSNWWDI